MWAKEIQKIKEGLAHILFYHSECPIVSTERRVEQTIFGCKSAQKQFQEAFEWLESDKRYFPYDKKDKYKWEDFKEQFKHGKADLYTDWDVHMFVHEKWAKWCNDIREKELETVRKNLIKTYSNKAKNCYCTSCGIKKPIKQFPEYGLHYRFAYGQTFWGEYVSVSIKDGTGTCLMCEQKRQEEYEEEMREYKRQWYQAHKAEISARQRERRHSNAEKDKAWKAAHKEQINQHIRERKQSDPIYKLKCQARTTIYKSFARTGNVKSERCEKLVGLSMDEFVTYLKETYEKTYGHPWDGIEPVHIDHIVPLATAQSEEDVMRLCHYTNLQLLTAQDNLAKGSKYAES